MVIPNRLGICVWSPCLDSQGNSLRGIEFCKRLNKCLDVHIFHNIISQKIDFNKNINETFIKMCSNNDINGIKNLINKVDINATDYDKRSGLHLAASEGHADVVNYLLENGALITCDRWNNTPFSEIENKTDAKYDTVKLLLNNWRKNVKSNKMFPKI